MVSLTLGATFLDKWVFGNSELTCRFYSAKPRLQVLEMVEIQKEFQLVKAEPMVSRKNQNLIAILA